MTSLEIINNLEKTLKDNNWLVTNIDVTEIAEIKKDLVLLEVLKEQAKHSKFYSEFAIQEINRKFDEMEEEGN